MRNVLIIDDAVHNDMFHGIMSAGIVLMMKCSWDKERWYCADDEMFMG